MAPVDQDHVKAALQGILRRIGIDGGNVLHGRTIEDLGARFAVDGVAYQLALIVSFRRKAW